jgi:hypothetical protein
LLSIHPFADKSKAEQDKKDPELLYAIKEKVDNSIICKTRDGSISRINIEGIG